MGDTQLLLCFRGQGILNVKLFSVFSSAHVLLIPFLSKYCILHVVIKFLANSRFETADELKPSLWKKLDVREMNA